MNTQTSHKNLLSWYDKHGRHQLPWRNTDDLYHIYLSEIMLQQTQVNRVRDEYYPQFLQRFSTLKSLGESPLDDVLSMWSGLGYYRRAKNLHKTAQLTQGILPTTLKELKKLPGIGQYTASAICSFGLHQAVTVVDTNISRVIKRYFALLDVSEKVVSEYAKGFLNTHNPRDHNLALMDLGSLVCVPKNPKCDECPLFDSCQGKDEAQLYTKTKKKEYISMELFFGVCIKDGKIALHLSDDNMYKDMLVLPKVEPLEENLLGSFKHAYTKYRLDVHIYSIDELDGEFVWLCAEEFENAPISSLTRKAQKFFHKKGL